MLFRLLGDTAGLHVVLELPSDYPAARLAASLPRCLADERGVAIHPIDRYFADPPAMSGPIRGYGIATLAQVRRAAAELAPLPNPNAIEPWKRGARGAPCNG